MIIEIKFIFSKFRRSDTHMSDAKNINVLQLEIKNKSISIQKILKIFTIIIFFGLKLFFSLFKIRNKGDAEIIKTIIN